MGGLPMIPRQDTARHSIDSEVDVMHQSLLPLLKQYFGFETFRPLQEEIIRDSLAGKDVFALLPTGGGKSLCFQLPALARPGLTLVISPLISLMKDQVDALQATGIAATFLNSSLAHEASRERIIGLHDGKYRLLYVAPERAMLSAFLNDITKWDVNLVAIDEAHCVSEWGHDFRPEYRQLLELRKLIPAVPFMALTATATSRVQADIHRYLHLRNAPSYIASFNRPNLSYRVVPKVDPYGQLLTFLRQRAKESGIVYCQSRKTTEMLSRKLSVDGISASPYHAGMEPADRARNQDRFLRDEITVICATIAFGMGINKSNVRFVVHYDLPKNIEGYYQETGRAGRDGLPSECLLLFSGGDIVKQLRFIGEKEDEQQRRFAKEQLEHMVRYAESHECRRLLLLEYFGELHPQPNCSGCDNCLVPRELVDATVEAQKLLSCVQRIRQRSGFSVGLRHVADVLTGGNTEKIRRWKHAELSTYGIGKDRSREEWMAIGRELMRLRLLQQNNDGGYGVAQVTTAGMEALEQRTTIRLAKSVRPEELPRGAGGEQEYDDLLFERLRMLRKRLADERDVPAFVIFSDYSLRQMARRYPSNENEFARISGVADKKLRDYGHKFIGEIADYLHTNLRKEFALEAQAITGSKGLNETTRETLRLFRLGKSVEAIAEERQLQVGTILSHLLGAVNAGEEIETNRLASPEEYRGIRAAFEKLGFGNLTGVFELFRGRFSYGLLRIVRLIEQRHTTGYENDR